ncbi:TetR/AcrR family transcriptional regulator [Umezawaea sp. Da 62-37]|uniref:TetR/AcrR family transcriptional regulator n=1 Tax=Umezawaea sp. Da 62-37 TaxID=3075927 RepID=UPI0028F736F0|nr:TetR/AcrR family transcriptional regulator [Umezawaea sp. Da 62-37]WNV87414.1 TetR/AcrR family transcriptional regulator [Umezawaea sp. Da 62-37]
MVSRTEKAATTRRELVVAATELLDEGGPEAVTLRAVSAQAGVSRGAPYGHFPDKEHLLAAVAEDCWTSIGEELDRLVKDRDLTPSERLERALAGLLDVGRRRPHAYALMFGSPSNASADAIAAVSRTHDQFLGIVSGVIGDPDRVKPTGALLMTSVHGMIGMENAGHLGVDKWQVTGDQLLRQLIGMIAADRPTGDHVV